MLSSLSRNKGRQEHPLLHKIISFKLQSIGNNQEGKSTPLQYWSRGCGAGFAAADRTHSFITKPGCSAWKGENKNIALYENCYSEVLWTIFFYLQQSSCKPNGITGKSGTDHNIRFHQVRKLFTITQVSFTSGTAKDQHKPEMWKQASAITKLFCQVLLKGWLMHF